MIGRRAAALGALAIALPASAPAQAAWPAKPIRLIVPYGHRAVRPTRWRGSMASG